MKYVLHFIYFAFTLFGIKLLLFSFKSQIIGS